MARAREPRFDGADRHAKGIRDLVVAQPVDFTQDDSRPLIKRQMVERRLQTLGELFLSEHPIGTGIAGRDELTVRRHVLIERHLIGAVAAPPEAVPVARLIDRDPVDPGAKRRLAAKTGDGSENPQKHLLREVEGLLAIAQQVHRQLDDHALMLGDELGAGSLLARCTPLHQRRFADANFRPIDCAGLLH